MSRCLLSFSDAFSLSFLSYSCATLTRFQLTRRAVPSAQLGPIAELFISTAKAVTIATTTACWLGAGSDCSSSSTSDDHCDSSMSDGGLNAAVQRRHQRVRVSCNNSITSVCLSHSPPASSTLQGAPKSGATTDFRSSAPYMDPRVV